MLLIKVNKLKKYYGDRLILDIDNLEVFSGEKIGLVGVNGSGKTTLLDIICGRKEADEGYIDVNRSFSYITQYDEKIDIIRSRVCKELNTPDEYKSHLSGGEKVKARVAKSLSENKMLIIADEPTANLDEKSINYIENKFKQYDGAIFLVSHDRVFIDNICSKIIELEDGRITVYNGNYSDYILQKQEKNKRAEFEYEQYIKEKKRLENSIVMKNNLRDNIRSTPRRFGKSEARLHKMGGQSARKSMESAIKSMETRIEKLEIKEKPASRRAIKIDIEDGHGFYANYPIDIKDLTLRFDDKVLLNKASFRMKKNKKVALLGDNGTGKTTLLNEILKGNNSIKVANKVNIGYFRQDLNILDTDKSIIDNIMEDSAFNQTYIRTTLARFLFRGDSVYKKVGLLSGGERVRVSLCKTLLSDNNLLILDEPTNYLDITSMESLEESLKNSNKSMIIVSHDRRLIREVCDEVLVIEQKKLIHYPYSYEKYMNKKNEIKDSIFEKNRKDRIMIINNKIAEIISLISIEENNEKKIEYEEYYSELIKELKKLS